MSLAIRCLSFCCNLLCILPFIPRFVNCLYLQYSTKMLYCQVLFFKVCYAQPVPVVVLCLCKHLHLPRTFVRLCPLHSVRLMPSPCPQSIRRSIQNIV